MPNIGGPELLVILLIFMLLFGWKKLPELGSSMAKSIKNFKAGMEEEEDERPETSSRDEDATGSSHRQ